MRRTIMILLFAAVLWGTAVSCSPAVEEDVPEPAPAEDEGGALNTAPEGGVESDSDVFPRATITPQIEGDVAAPEEAAENEEGYPVPPLPVATPLPEGYELPTTEDVNPYPEASGTLIWIIKPVGEQCAETPTTPDLQTAVADMVAANIPVEASEMIDLAVCADCGCPTSAHFRLQIDSGYLGNAEALGWTAEE